MLEKLNLTRKEDAIKFILEKEVKILNLCHIPEDGRLKTLSFAVPDEKRVYQILEFGERVDGSSLFSYIDPNKSDIYITPKLESAFLNPFSSLPTLNILCRYLDENGTPLDVAPESILSRAENRLRSSTNVALKTLAELEFYIISTQESETLFPTTQESHYHESTPFSQFENLRDEILVTLAKVGIVTKYGHGEVGKIQAEGLVLEQHEIELMPENLTKTAEEIAVAKWVIRNVCVKHGVTVSFLPKIALQAAGNGMHIHICALKDGRNIIAQNDGTLSVEAREIIGGILKFASSLAAFGNMIPVSYLRFITRKESPMHVCWGARNRLALIRIPLWWDFKENEEDMDACKRTVEYRGPDPSANAYLLFAGIAVAAEYGLKNSEESLRIAEELHAEVAKRSKRLTRLPQSCSESATHLERDRKYYEAEGVFPKAVIDKTAKKLKSYRDKTLLKKLKNEPQRIEELMQEYMHYG